jgi:hypothetical protein
MKSPLQLIPVLFEAKCRGDFMSPTDLRRFDIACISIIQRNFICSLKLEADLKGRSLHA